MRKSEMSEQRLGERALVIDILSKAGWSETPMSKRFYRGLWLQDEATMEYDHEQIDLSLNYSAEKSRMRLTIDTSDGRHLFFDLYPKGHVQQVLELIEAHQDQLDKDTVGQLLRPLVEICPETYFYPNADDAPVLVVADGNIGAQP